MSRSPPLEQAAAWLKDAEALYIGAGAGLSAAAGLDFLDSAAFAASYPGMLQYGFRCKLDLMGRVDLPQELLWGYYLPHVQEVRFGAPAPRGYPELLELARRVGEHFVKTTNADGLFERHGFEPERLYTPQGDYARYQCLRPCTQEAWPTQALLAEYLPRIDRRTQRLPRGQHPACPRCGGPTFLNVRGGDWFVEAPYLRGGQLHQRWLQQHLGRRLVLLEIGSGFNTPTWIRWPAEQLVRRYPSARLIRVNPHDPEVPGDLAGRAVGLAASAASVIGALLEARSGAPGRELAGPALG